MQLKFALAAAFAALAVADPGFTVPADTPDGVYSITFENGVAKHNKIAEAEKGAVEKRTPLLFWGWGGRRRYYGPVGGVDCGDAELDFFQLRFANRNLGRKCGGVFGKDVQAGQTVYAVVGNVVSYACNQGGGEEECDSWTRSRAVNNIMRQCGYNREGSAMMDDQMLYGYGPKGTEFCNGDVKNGDANNNAPQNGNDKNDDDDSDNDD